MLARQHLKNLIQGGVVPGAFLQRASKSSEGASAHWEGAAGLEAQTVPGSFLVFLALTTAIYKAVNLEEMKFQSAHFLFPPPSAM